MTSLSNRPNAQVKYPGTTSFNCANSRREEVIRWSKCSSSVTCRAYGFQEKGFLDRVLKARVSRSHDSFLAWQGRGSPASVTLRLGKSAKGRAVAKKQHLD
jgi:hypothetical protein